MDVYRFYLHHSKNYRAVCEHLQPMSRQFLAELFSFEDQKRVAEWIKSDAGKKLRDSLTRVLTDQFRNLWNVPGLHAVSNISREEYGYGDDIIGIGVCVSPPVRKWFYTVVTNRRMVSMCESLRSFWGKLDDAEN
jgi:hypothetical protein